MYENPARSHFWRVAKLAADLLGLRHAWDALEDSVFDACMWGGERDKATTFRATRDVCVSLRRKCNGMHARKSWTPVAGPAGPEFPTASEAEYPRELCEAYIKCVWQQLRRTGVKAPKASVDAAATGARDLRQFSMKRVPPSSG